VFCSGSKLMILIEIDSEALEAPTPTRRGKSYPPPLTASLVKKSKLKLFAPPQELVLTSDDDDEDVSGTAATNRLLVIYGKTQPPNRHHGRISKAEKEKVSTI